MFSIHHPLGFSKLALAFNTCQKYNGMEKPYGIPYKHKKRPPEVV